MARSIDINSLPVRVLRAANAAPRLLVCLACAGMAVPAVCTGLAALQRNLGPNPLEVLIRQPGHWALVWLLTALGIAPSRRVCVIVAIWLNWRYGKRFSDWNWLIRLRRPVGLASFFYAVMHLAVYLSLDLDFNWNELLNDLRDKPHIGFGVATFVLLFPLAVTSTDGWMKRLKRNWKRLHTLIYPAAILAIVHFILLSKPGIAEPFCYALVLAGLLHYRYIERRAQSKMGQECIDGAVPERPPIRPDSV